MYFFYYNSFFISYDKEKIYKIKNNKQIVAFDDQYFIQIASTFYIQGNVLTDQYQDGDKNKMNVYFEGFTEDYELSGEKNFFVKKFEVYQINI